ncbi:hypothetical protein Ddye_019542 [Dipteronia dyeriana]|uniref:Uncharacterized protein n=1 Tax=Dipteronia dyeriana TaxID=168575 RepID=A0AAD9TY93_9ROSI|nr:hypothetical protein Ddye_019542 [Dipteronia dyeriana]
MHHSTRSNNLHDLRFDPDIEGTTQRNRRIRRLAMEDGFRDQDPILATAQRGKNEQNGEDGRAMRDYVRPRVDPNISLIQLPTIVVNNFEIIVNVFQMLTMMGQFSGFPSEDPNGHLRNFDQIC